MIRIFLLLLLIQLSLNNLCANSRLQLRNIAFKEGLNNMNVSAIAQDQLGYIWVATMGGVSRYNGYEFKRYYFDASDSASLRSNHVASLLCSSDGLLYIGTVSGIDYYDCRTEKLVSLFPDFVNTVLSFAERDGFIYVGTNIGLYRFKPGTNKLEELGSQLIGKLVFNCLLFDKIGNLWCGLDAGRGLAMVDVNANRVDFYPCKDGISLLNINVVRTLFQPDENLLLLGTKGGLGCFDLRTRQYTAPKDYSQLISGLSGYDVRFIMEKEPSIYWIGTLQSGMFIYDKARNSLVRHFQDDGYSEIHSNNYMTCLTDRSGNVWLGTFDAGLEVSLKQAKNFNFDVSLNKLTQRKFITAITSDHKKNLIIATRENGFVIYNPDNKKSIAYDKTNSKLGHQNIRSVFVDSENQYWIGLYSGLQIFDSENKTFKTLSVPEPNNGAVSILQVNNNIFVGTDGQGLLVFDLKGNLLDQFLKTGVNIPMIIRLNVDEMLFVSYGLGLFTMNLSDHAIKRVELADIKKYRGLLFAMTAFKDKEGKIWVGTYNYGLFSFDLKKSEVRNFNIKQGLPSSDAIGIAEDDNHNLWISTSFGLAKLNKSSGIIKTYYFIEGVNNHQFHGKAVFKDNEGTIYFGGNLGLTYFNSAEILLESSEAPRVVLENLFIQNRLVIPSTSNSILSRSLSFTDGITLSYKDQSFSIDFVSFDFLSPEKMVYSYIMEGYEKEWNNIGAQRKVSYSNLPRGNYVFKVKSVNGAGIKSENEAALMIQVKPAPWFSYLAWAIYIAIMAGITYFFFRLRIKTFVYKKNLEIEHSEHQREREINVMKQKFFTNISHELRTPLTLIYGLVSQLSRQEKLSPQIKEFAQSLDINVNRLLKLINQLLTFKKIESESLSLWLEMENINESIRRIVALFSLYAKEKEIRIDFLEEDRFTLCFDYDKLEKILSNLLSNAIKHSEKGGRIEVTVKMISRDQTIALYNSNLDGQVADYVEISVADAGPGIDEKDWSTIFDRYKQIESHGKQRPDYSGTGIGLNFTKSLVELHKGKIRMDSKMGQGTTFAFILPGDCSVFEPKDFANTNNDDHQKVGSEKGLNIDEPDLSKEFAIHADFEKTVLVVEDDPQLNNFLVNSLKDYYKIITAHDGEIGLKMVKKDFPDIVVSDVMMPKKDGYELTKSIKENKELCHIPVILLTAKSETASQIEGMQSGADFYIAKPFNLNFLLAAIDSQLKNRKRIQKMFFNGMMPNLNKLEINQLDLTFLSRLNLIIEKELSNTELDISFLAKSLNMSRSSFYRKFLSLTSLSPIAYIRKFRINKSIALMATGKYSLSKVSEMTGFSSQSYFSTAFRQEQNLTPSEFLNRPKNANE